MQSTTLNPQISALSQSKYQHFLNEAKYVFTLMQTSKEIKSGMVDMQMLFFKNNLGLL